MGEGSWGTMATAQALPEVPDTLRVLLARIVARDSDALGALFNAAGGRLLALASMGMRMSAAWSATLSGAFTKPRCAPSCEVWR